MRESLSQIAVVLAIGVVLVYRFKAVRRGERLERGPEGFWRTVDDRMSEGLLQALVLRMFMLTFTVLTLGWVIGLERETLTPFAAGVRWVGVGLCFVTAALYAWVLRTLGSNLSDTITTHRDHTLVTTGPYRWVRHPFYSCTGLFVLSVFLMSGSWRLLFFGSAMVALLTLRCRAEELRLGWRFRTLYWEYRYRTGAFFPRWRR